MKFGVRKPSIKKSIKAKTTGRAKRNMKKTINPSYGTKGIGYVKNPKKAIYNNIYNKTTVGIKIKPSNKTKIQIKKNNNANKINTCYDRSVEDKMPYDSSKTIKDDNQEKVAKKIYKEWWFWLIIIILILGIIETIQWYSDTTPANITSFETTNIEENSITIFATIEEEESSIDKIEYSIDENTWIECTINEDEDNNDYYIEETIEELEAGTEYTIYLKVTNFKGLTTEDNITISTETIVEEETLEETSEEETTEETTSSQDAIEQRNNFKAILNNLYPYGYSLSFLENPWISTEDEIGYTGTIDITNAYGTEATYDYGVEYNLSDNSVLRITINNSIVYEQ